MIEWISEWLRPCDVAMPRSCNEQAQARLAVSWRDERVTLASGACLATPKVSPESLGKVAAVWLLNCRGAFSTVVAEDCFGEDCGQLVSWHNAESVTAVFSCLLVEFETLLTLNRESRDTLTSKQTNWSDDSSRIGGQSAQLSQHSIRSQSLQWLSGVLIGRSMTH